MMIAPVGTFVLVAYFFSIFGIAYSESPLSFPPLIRALLSSNWSGFAVVVLIFLGIIFAIKFLVSTCLDIFMFASRGERGMKALYSSSTYVRGIWWPVFGRMLFFLFLTIGALFGLYLIILIAAFSPLVQTNHFIGWGSLVLILLISALFAPLGWSFLFALYEGLHAFRGDLQPQPTGMQRFSYITSVILGVLMVAVLIMVFMWGTIYIENVLQNLISFPITPLPNSDLFIPSFELPSSTSSTP